MQSFRQNMEENLNAVIQSQNYLKNEVLLLSHELAMERCSHPKDVKLNNTEKENKSEMEQQYNDKSSQASWMP